MGASPSPGLVQAMAATLLAAVPRRLAMGAPIDVARIFTETPPEIAAKVVTPATLRGAEGPEEEPTRQGDAPGAETGPCLACPPPGGAPVTSPVGAPPSRPPASVTTVEVPASETLRATHAPGTHRLGEVGADVGATLVTIRVARVALGIVPCKPPDLPFTTFKCYSSTG